MEALKVTSINQKAFEMMNTFTSELCVCINVGSSLVCIYESKVYIE